MIIMMIKPHRWKRYEFFERKEGLLLHHVTGLIRDDNRVYLKVCYPPHYFRKFRGFGISESILEDLKRRGVVQIRVVYYKTMNKNDRKETFRVSLSVWEKEGIRHVNEDNPQDVQIILPKSKMISDKKYQEVE